jgi:N-acetylmuramate 1-kinase
MMMKNTGALYTEVREMVDQQALGDETLASWVKKAKTITQVVKLPGDASTRRYYRLWAGDISYILMRLEPFTDKGKKLDFLEMQRHLFDCDVNVPKVLEADAERGFILLEDLGDVTLLRRLQEVSNPDIERHLYEGVIDSLVDMQVKASPARKPSNVDAYGLFFDHKKLMWEVNFCIEHFYQVYLGRKMTDADMKTMVDGFSEICTYLADQPTVLTHRDFHSRNIMVTPDERLVMIDFQDARLGPAQYDLASLLKDSYYQLEEKQISRLIDYYTSRWEAVSGEKLDRTKFREVFDMMSVQRNFKAIGSFASFLNRRGNATYLKYIGNTFENIRRTLLKYPKYSALREVLFHYYYF